MSMRYLWILFGIKLMSFICLESKNWVGGFEPETKIIITKNVTHSHHKWWEKYRKWNLKKKVTRFKGILR